MTFALNYFSLDISVELLLHLHSGQACATLCPDRLLSFCCIFCCQISCYLHAAATNAISRNWPAFFQVNFFPSCLKPCCTYIQQSRGSSSLSLNNCPRHHLIHPLGNHPLVGRAPSIRCFIFQVIVTLVEPALLYLDFPDHQQSPCFWLPNLHSPCPSQVLDRSIYWSDLLC
jgi:hypothetical protein